MLERLQAHNFKQLRDIDLAFPRTCRVLIEGLNEAGKSTLFEAIHFVLYGRGLVTLGRGRGSTDSIISYGEQAAYVAADLSLDGTRVRVERVLTRSRTSQAWCVIERPDGTREEVRQTQRVNDELLAHLSGLDSDSLLASCFVEQKKLAKLEELTRDRRQEVLLKLLDLDRLTRVKRRFAWDRRDDQGLSASERRLRLAEAARCLVVLRSALDAVERRATLATIHVQIAEADRAARRAADLGTELAGLAGQIEEVSAQIATTESLDRAIALLERAHAHGVAADDSRRRAAEFDEELATLSRLASVTIPALESGAALLTRIIGLLTRVADLDARIAPLRERARRLSGIGTAGEALERLASELARARETAGRESAMCAAAKRDAMAAERVAELRRRADEADTDSARRADLGLRIRAAASAWADARDRDAEADRRTPDLTAAEEAASCAAGQAEAARRLDACRAELRELEFRTHGVRAREQRLIALERLQHSLQHLSGTAESSDSAVESALQALNETRERLRDASIARALAEWVHAARASETRAAGQSRIARLAQGAEEARASHRRALDRVRTATRLVVGGSALALLGIAAFVAFHAAIVLTVVGGGIAAVAWARRGSARGEAGRAGETAREREAAARDARVRLEALLGARSPDLAAIEARLHRDGAAVPTDPDEAAHQAATLLRDLPSEGALLAREQDGHLAYERANDAARGVRARLDVERRHLAEQMRGEGLGASDDIGRRRQEMSAALDDLVVRADALEREASVLARMAPADSEFQQLANVADEARQDAQRLHHEIEYERRRARDDCERASAALRDTGVNDPGEAETAASSLDREAARLAESAQALRAEAQDLERTLPAGWSGDTVREAHGRAEVTLRGAELAAHLLAAQLAAADAAMRSDLDAAELATWQEAKSAMPEIETEAGVVEAERERVAHEAMVAGEPYSLPVDVEAARRRAMAEQARVQQQRKEAGERLQARGAVEQRRREAVDAAQRHRAQGESLRQDALAILLTISSEPTLGTATDGVLAAARSRRASVDLDVLRSRHAELRECSGQVDATRRRALEDESQARLAAAALARALGVILHGPVSPETLRSSLPDLDSVSIEDRPALERERVDLLGKVRHEDETALELEATLHVRREDLDEAICRREAAQRRRRREVCEGASTVLDRVRNNVLQAVLPNTMAYMCLLLPLLTAGRYHDAQLDDGSYRIEVWDNQAQGYVEKDIFSGATQDQFSLALRLGFALAALPRERGARPGFLFMDEPVAGFDHERRDALLRLLTAGHLADSFPQVFLAVPAGVFERNPLPYLVRLDRGRVVQSTLPARQALLAGVR